MMRQKYIGGIAGINTGLIINCTNNADITGLAYVGGITGQLGAQFKGSNRVSGNLINVTNNGTVTATSRALQRLEESSVSLHTATLHMPQTTETYLRLLKMTICTVI